MISFLGLYIIMQTGLVILRDKCVSLSIVKARMTAEPSASKKPLISYDPLCRSQINNHSINITVFFEQELKQTTKTFVPVIIGLHHDKGKCL